MKILLINPPRSEGCSIVREVRCAGLSLSSVFPPIRLAYVAALLEKNNFDVDILDCNANEYDFDKIEDKVRKDNPEIVIFTSSPTTMSHDVTVAQICKKINNEIITVLDDSHVAPVMPEKVLKSFENIDILIKGESEATALDICQNHHSLAKVKGISYRVGTKIINNPPREPIDINTLPPPSYHLLPLNKYTSINSARKRPFATIITSVGCPFNCSFCIIGGATVWRGYGKKWRSKSSKKVVEEIEFLVKKHGIKSFYIWDATFTIDKERVIEICQKLIEKAIKVEWACNSRVDTIDEEMLEKMKKAGCWKICYGVETGAQNLLNDASKGTYIEDIKNTFKLTNKVGISPTASFMIGLPGETRETINKTLKLAKELDPFRAQFVLTTPYPGTKIYDYVKENRLLVKDYSFSGFDAYGVDSPPVMSSGPLSSQDLLKEQKRIFREFYFSPHFFLKTLLKIRSISEISTLMRAARYLF